MVDLFTVIPFWVTTTATCPFIDDVHDFRQFVFYIVCVSATVRVLRFLRIHRLVLLRVDDEVKRSILDLVLVFLALVAFNSVVIQRLEAHIQPHPFHTCE